MEELCSVLSVSMGVAGKTKTAAAPEAVMKNADKALYKAKQQGRNCVVKG